ncbi:MAG: carboxypeptidase-like regulatory domain-containing protein [Planctomycetota bacterium]
MEADAQGEFSAGGFARVRYAVEVRAVGCATRIVPEVIPGADPIVITLEKGYAVHGFVLDTAGLPVMTARVQAVGLPEESGAHPIASESVDAKGRFHLAGLAGRYARVRISAPGYHATTLDRIRPDTRLRVVLQRR